MNVSARTYLASSLFLFGLSSLPLPTYAATTFCLADGMSVSAEKFETKDGKFFLYVAGSDTPLEYPSSSVKGINVACQVAPPTPSPGGVAKFGIHGSNTIGERLMPMLIDTFGRKRFDTAPIMKPRAPEEQDITLRAGKEPRATIDLQAHGSGTSAKALMEGKAVIGMSSRRANIEEAQALAVRFNTNIWAPGNEHVLALDGLAVIVNPNNPVRQLTLDVIAGIFAGEITDWSLIGGPAAPIVMHARDDKSGTYDTFNSLVLKPLSKKISPSATRHESSENLSEAVASDPNAIGFIGLPYINKNTALSIASACGVQSGPSKYTIKTEEYPLARRLFLYTLGVPTEPVARDLLTFALSDEAQSTVADAGFIDQAIDLQDFNDQQRWSQALVANPGFALPPGKRVPQDMVTAFGQVMTGVRRTTAVFRFEPSSAQLDTRALQDVSRLARYLTSPQASGKPYYIAGFADSDGSWNKNARLAYARAAEVGTALQRLGIIVPKQSILSLSYMSPVACNDTDEGKGKNRRVEIWVGK